MSTCYLPSRLKKWSFFLFLFILLGGFAAVSSGFAACEYLSADFSSGSGWTADNAIYWSTYHYDQLDAHGMVNDTSTYAQIDFMPSDFFSVDVDVEIVSTADQHDRVGIRFRTSDNVFSVQGDSGQLTTNGVLCYYYPKTGLLKFKVYDFGALPDPAWVVPLAARSVSGTVQSIGLSMVADGVIFRVNGQDTSYKLKGDFSFGPSVINQLRLYAGAGADAGGTLHARFDNVCASPYEVTDFQPGNAMPVPFGQEAPIITTPAADPVTSVVPGSANPLGFGPAANGGNILSLTAELSGLTYPADLYVGIQIGSEIYLFDANNIPHALSTDGLVKWRSNTPGGINARILPDIDMSGLPGTYNFYFLMTPTGRFDAYRLWVTPLTIAGGGGGTPVVTDNAMKQEIQQNINLIFGLTSGFSGGLTEVMKIFEDKNVVTTTPAELDLSSLLGGAPITIDANLGSGYRMESGHVMAGSARIVLSNVQFSNTSLGANFSATFNNVTKDGAPFVNGQLSGNILMTEGAGDTNNISGQINISSLSISGQPMSGTIGISGTLSEINLGALLNAEVSKLLETTGNIRLTFTNFTSGAYTVNSGTVDLNSTQSGQATISTNLQTNQGPVTLNMTSAASATSAVINTTAPGTAGPYTVSIANVTMNQNACANYPTGGTVSFTSHSTGKTGVVTFNGVCDGTYGYTEQ